MSLSTVESHRVAAAIEQALERLQLVASVTPDLDVGENVSAVIGEGITRALGEQRALESKYEDLVAARARERAAGNKARYKQLQSEIQETAFQIRESMKNLCRVLKDSDNPDVNGNFERILEERQHLLMLLERALADAREGNYRSLAAQVEKDTREKERLSAAASREEELTKEVEALSATLKSEEEKHATDMEAKRAELQALKEKARALKADTAMTVRVARREVVAKTTSLARAHTADEAEVVAKIEDLRRRIELDVYAHGVTMETLKTDTEEFNKRAAETRATTAAQAAEKTATVETLTATRAAQVEEVTALKAKYDAALRALADEEAATRAAEAAAAAAKAREVRETQVAMQLQHSVWALFSVIKAEKDRAAAEKKAAKDKAKKK